jgi:hypothetical protein
MATVAGGTMKIALGSMFRNSLGYLDRYFSQVLALKLYLESNHDHLQLIFAEGDSYDDTWTELAKRTESLDAVLLKRAHGSKHAWHSVDIPERWKAISWVCNGILDHVEMDVDAFIYVESDLGWRVETMASLLNQLDALHPAIAPMCFTAVGDFYDIWGHIKDGEHFSPFPPYHSALGSGLTEIDSAGSCTAMLGAVARSARYDSTDHCRGLGRSIRKAGWSIWVDPNVRVVHY